MWGSLSMSVEMPKVLRVGYQDVKIMPENSSMADSHGEYNTDTATIRINLENSPVEIVNTLLHETLHAVWYTYGLTTAFPDKDKHEHIVTTMANALTQVFRDNAGLLEWIDESLKDNAA